MSQEDLEADLLSPGNSLKARKRRVCFLFITLPEQISPYPSRPSFKKKLVQCLSPFNFLVYFLIHTVFHLLQMKKIKWELIQAVQGKQVWKKNNRTVTKGLLTWASLNSGTTAREPPQSRRWMLGSGIWILSKIPRFPNCLTIAFHLTSVTETI